MALHDFYTARGAPAPLLPPRNSNQELSLDWQRDGEQPGSILPRRAGAGHRRVLGPGRSGAAGTGPWLGSSGFFLDHKHSPRQERGRDRARGGQGLAPGRCCGEQRGYSECRARCDHGQLAPFFRSPSPDGTVWMGIRGSRGPRSIPELHPSTQPFGHVTPTCSCSQEANPKGKVQPKELHLCQGDEALLLSMALRC